MSFHEITGITPNLPASAEQFPVFLFPDITGDCLGLLQLAHQLQAARGNKSRIYIWHDPKASESGRSLSAYAEQIKDEITQLLTVGPCFLGGYSFGGSLGAVVAQKLSAAQRKVSLFVIDTPSIEGSQAYLQAQNEAATQDLFSIFSYAASLASHYTAQKMDNPKLSESDFKALSQKTIEEQISYLKDLFIEAANKTEQKACEAKLESLKSQALEEQLSSLTTYYKRTATEAELIALSAKSTDEQLAILKDFFLKNVRDENLSRMLAQYATVVTQNLLSLLKHQDKTSYAPLAKISLFLSQESQNKYGFNIAKSWDTYCHEGEMTPLADSTHLSLIKNKHNSRIVAEKMSAFFKNYFSTKEIITMLLTPWISNHPEVDLYELVHDLSKSKPASGKTVSSSVSSDSMQINLHTPTPPMRIPQPSTQASILSSLSLTVTPPEQESFMNRRLQTVSHSASTSPLLSSLSSPTVQQPALSSSPFNLSGNLSFTNLNGSSPILSPLLSSSASPDTPSSGMPSLQLSDGNLEDIDMVLSETPQVRRKKTSVPRQNPTLLQQPATFFTLHPTRVTRTQERRQDAALLGSQPQQLGSNKL